MPKLVSPKEILSRIEQGRTIRYHMERCAITNDDLVLRFKVSKSSIRLALRTHNMPSLRDRIEKFVMKQKPTGLAA